MLPLRTSVNWSIDTLFQMTKYVRPRPIGGRWQANFCALIAPAIIEICTACSYWWGVRFCPLTTTALRRLVLRKMVKNHRSPIGHICRGPPVFTLGLRLMVIKIKSKLFSAWLCAELDVLSIMEELMIDFFLSQLFSKKRRLNHLISSIPTVSRKVRVQIPKL